MLNRRIVLSAVLIMGMAAAAFATSGWSYTGPERTMYLTFSKPVALPGATLAAGTYVFEMANPSTSGDVIRVSEKAHKRVYFLGFADRISKPASLAADRFVTLGVTPHFTKQAAAPRITAWFPLGESFGYHFRYRE